MRRNYISRISRAELLIAALALTATRAEALTINAIYDPTVPTAAQTAFDAIVQTYDRYFDNTATTVNLTVQFGGGGLASSLTYDAVISYGAWRADMLATAAANPANAYLGSGAATLPGADPLNGDLVQLAAADARAIGVTAAQVVAGSLNPGTDSQLTFSGSAAFCYTSCPQSSLYDFVSIAQHELNEALGIGSALSGLANNAAAPSNSYQPQDFFRFDSAGNRLVTTDPNAAVYFSYDGATLVAQFNQDSTAKGNTAADRNDWCYGNGTCPDSPAYVQNAIDYPNTTAPGLGQGTPEAIVLRTLGYGSSASPVSEPGGLPLLGASLLGIGFVRRARRP